MEKAEGWTIGQDLTLPDLEIDSLTPLNDTVSAGETISVGAVVHNYGKLASGAFSTRIYISPRNTYDSSAIPLATFDGATYVPLGLAAGAVTTYPTKSVTFDAALTSKLFSGTNYLIVIADYNNEFLDLNRDNNSYNVPIKLDTTFPVEPQSTLPVSIGGTATISHSFLFSYDPDNSAAELTYTVLGPPTHGTILVNGSAATSFTQADIDNGLVQYRENGDAASNDSFMFQVTDPAGNRVGPEPFKIAILNTAAPVIDANATLLASLAGTVIWTDALCTVALGNTPAQMTYTLLTPPTHGALLVSGAPAISFTQADIDNRIVGYLAKGDAATSDSFTFQVSDAAGDHTAVTTFNIAIQSAPPSAAAVDDGTVFIGAPTQTITGSTGAGSSVTIIGATGDTITGGAGSDLINAMAGSQVVTGGSGATTVWGGAGDVIAGGTGRLLVDGGLGAQQQISGGSGASTILGGAGDRITGSTGLGSSVIVGAAGDTIAGGSGSDLINGLAGSQAIFGGSGNTTVWGGPGNTIVGGQGQLVVDIDQANFPGAVLVGDIGSKGATTVTGFSQLAGDRLFFQNETSASIDSVIASSQTRNGNTLITLPDGATMTLVGVTRIDSTFFR